ncbi:MAG: hypothetical protein JOY71_11405 [Acetobacteraceae bacterium]|nr:hypothetical protein [Acetobacteraceae bacterium]
MNRFTRLAALVCAGALSSHAAFAHVVAGARVFPGTLTFDDPGTADEASVPTITYNRIGSEGGPGPTHEVDLGFEYDKRITSNTAIIFNYGYNILQTEHDKTHTGFQNLFITGKWQAYTNAEHEFIFSLGVIRELGRTGTQHIGADEVGSTAPTLYFGKGMGDLPISYLRPLAITGELNYSISDKELKGTPVINPDTGMMSVQFNNGMANRWFGGISIQYSLPYLQSQVKDISLGRFFGGMVPILEITWSSPASSPSALGTTYTFAPGVIYLGPWYQIGVEALIPGNKTTGTNVGAIAQFRLFFDDLLPNSLGRPIFRWP